ncbi:MAG: hypothetical protein NT059_09630 [Planctomycetota bacterium]|nr:hypothetical protein [Planctomycetota bacterium]
MPWNDWQFLVATAGAAIALAFMIKPLLARRKNAACGGCGPTPANRPKRATLTIGNTERDQPR